MSAWGDYLRQLRAERRALGICAWCPRYARPYALCLQCRRKNAKRQIKLYRRKKRAMRTLRAA